MMDIKTICLGVGLSLFLTACLSNYKHPSFSGDPATMSGQTLCYRYGTTKAQTLKDEIDARRIDCEDYLERDPLFRDYR